MSNERKAVPEWEANAVFLNTTLYMRWGRLDKGE